MVLVVGCFKALHLIRVGTYGAHYANKRTARTFVLFQSVPAHFVRSGFSGTFAACLDERERWHKFVVTAAPL